MTVLQFPMDRVTRKKYVPFAGNVLIGPFIKRAPEGSDELPQTTVDWLKDFINDSAAINLEK